MGDIVKSTAEAAADGVALIAPTAINASMPERAGDAPTWSDAIIESFSEALVATSLEGRIVGWNAAAAEISGYRADEVLGRDWDFMVPPEELATVAQGFERFQIDENSFRLETLLRRKDGALLETLLSISAIRDRAGTLIGFSAMLRDIGEEKLAERKLRQSEEKFKNIFQYSSEAISIASLEDGKYLEVNDEFCRTIDLPREEILGKTPLDLGFFTPIGLFQFGLELREKGVIRDREISGVDRWGNIYDTLVSAVVVQVDGKKCALGISKNITGLKRTQDDLLRAERQLNDVLANAPLVVLAIDNNRVITAARGRALIGMPYTADQLVGKSLGEIFFRGLNPLLKNFDRALAGETFSAAETLLQGSISFDVWYSPLWDQEHKVIGATAVATDVTARKRAEDELRRSEEYYRSLVENSADLTAVSNEDGIILFAAGEGHKDFGLELSDLIGHHAMEFIHPDKHEEQARKIAESFEHPSVIGRGEAPIRCRDGSWLDCELVGRAAIGPDGKRILVSTVRNISARKRAELEIASSRDQALAASRAKSEFLSSMSHEIRTPMNAILGMADLMWETELSKEQRRYLDTMINNGNALLELINSILDLAKVESGRLNLEAVDFDLRELIEKVADTLAVRSDEKGLELGVRIDHDVPTALVGDPLRLRQVLTNLVGNAIKFTERGAVVIRVRRDRNGAGPGALQISVSDTGIGIAAEKLPGLFDPFSQADSSVTRKYGGTGLGLAIVDRLVRQMGGSVSVDSVPGSGSTFSFTSRFEVSARAASMEPVRDAAPNLRGVKVLVVDDSAINRTIVRELLSPCGAIVVEAASGMEGIDRYREAGEEGRPFRLLISDHLMPEMDGFEMVRRIREMATAGDLSIMMLSSTDLPQTLAKVRQLGIEWYVVKPVKRAELYAAIARAMSDSERGASIQPASQARAGSLHALSLPVPLRILLADDSPDNRLLIRAYLRKTPYQLDEAEDGKKAIEMVFNGAYDVILMDIQMPRMDGYTAVAQIRDWESRTDHAHTPIIALTASALGDAVRQSRTAGFDLHVTKPVKRETLLNAIAKACAGRPDSARGRSLEASRL